MLIKRMCEEIWGVSLEGRFKDLKGNPSLSVPLRDTKQGPQLKGQRSWGQVGPVPRNSLYQG